MTNNPQVGDTVWIKDENKPLQTGTITKIGNKYYRVVQSGWDENEFYKDSLHLKSRYGGYNTILYINEQDYYDEIEMKRLFDEIKAKFDCFNRSKFRMNQLKRIAEIINE